LFYTQNILELAAVVCGMIATSMRLFDAFSDPLVGFLMDKTNGRFGRYRPFMVIGNLLTVTSMAGMFWGFTSLTSSMKYIMVFIFYLIFTLGYTFVTTCNKGGQAVVTNDPKQRPLFALFFGIYNAILSAVLVYSITSWLAPNYALGLRDPILWRTVGIGYGLASMLCTILAVIGISSKDKPEFFGLGKKAAPLEFKDIFRLLKGNRALQMLAIGASTEKLGWTLSNAANVYLFSNIIMNTQMMGKVAMYILWPSLFVVCVGVIMARRVGLKKSFVLANWVSLLGLVALLLIRPFSPDMLWVFIILVVIQQAAYNFFSNLINPLIADCTDYETYLTGKFMAGTIGGVFAFVDKGISSISTTLLGVMLAFVGMGNTVIPQNTPAPNSLYMVVLISMYILPILAHITTLIAFKHYPLSLEFMEKIQIELNERKQNLK
jgi:Na+/melibiose symporter-like transporter